MKWVLTILQCTGYDLQAEGQSPLDSLRKGIKSVIKNSKSHAVAGGIKPDTIKEIVAGLT